MDFLKKIINNFLDLYLCDKSKAKIKNILKEIYFIFPFGFIAFCFRSKAFRSRANLVFNFSKYHYELNGLDYVKPDLNCIFSQNRGGV